MLTYDYKPTDRQLVAHRSKADETLYGGAAGGGKSRYARAEAVLLSQLVPGSATLILRRKFVDLNRAGGMIPMLRQEMPPGLGTYNEATHQWRMLNGSTIELGYLERDVDTERYQGAEYTLIVVDEAGQFDGSQIDFLSSRLRSAGRVKHRLDELGMKPRLILTANPGGIGHAYLRRRYVTAVPPGTLWRPKPTDTDPDPATRLYVPAKVTDNPHVDVGYVRRLGRLNPERRRALLEGDWDSFSGNAFPNFNRATHVLDDIPPYPQGASTMAWGVDYGLSAPFAAVLGELLPDGLIVIHAEIEQAELTPAQQADAILGREGERWRTSRRSVPVALDPACWSRNPHDVQQRQVVADSTKDVPPHGSIARAYYDRFGADLEKGRNDRLAGWALLRDRLEVRPDGLPRILISPACTKLAAKLPALPRSSRNPEDVDTKSDDHLADSLRYLCMLFASRFKEVNPIEPEDDSFGGGSGILSATAGVASARW